MAVRRQVGTAHAGHAEGKHQSAAHRPADDDLDVGADPLVRVPVLPYCLAQDVRGGDHAAHDGCCSYLQFRQGQEGNETVIAHA
jgi:hypothetical protein